MGTIPTETTRTGDAPNRREQLQTRRTSLPSVRMNPPPPEVAPGGGPLSNAVATAAVSHGDRPAVCTATTTTTWAEVDRAATNLLAPLAALGVRSGDTVALSMHSGPRWLVAATAVNRLGATIAGISPVLPATQRAELTDLVDPALVLAEEDLVDGLPLRRAVAVFSADGLGLDGPTPPEEAGVTAPEKSGVTPPEEARVTAPEEAGGNRTPRADLGVERAPYAICFTSGTTGRPRAAVFEASAAEAVLRIDLGPEPPVGAGGHIISSTQFAHVGFVLKAPGHALLGSTIHVMDRWSATGAIELAERHRMSTLGVVAPQIALMLRSPAMATADLSALRTVIAGGAPSPEALVGEVRRRLGVTYSIRWSSTESGGVGLAADVDDDHPDAVGTIGTPRPGVDARVADPEGVVLDAGEVGELQIRSDAVMSGYRGDLDATAGAFTPDGWLRTGDLARVRPDGRFVLAGRRSEMFIRGGYNVHPQEVEAVLGTHVAVGQVALVPRDHDVLGQVGVAVVVPAADRRPPTLEELRRHAGDRLARHQLPEDLVVRGSLPMTAGGKLDRRRLADEVR